jgi:hypothetical protein
VTFSLKTRQVVSRKPAWSSFKELVDFSAGIEEGGVQAVRIPVEQHAAQVEDDGFHGRIGNWLMVNS